MLTKHTLQFLEELSHNNTKSWFEQHRNRYTQAQSEIKSFIEIWLNEFGKIDESIAHLDPKKCIFRIHRDVRFSANKNPYKTNLGAYLYKGDKQANYAGYYLHIEPGNCFFAAGNYMPMPEQLAKIRQEIDYNLHDFQKILQQKQFKEIFGNISSENKLKRAPKGYDEDNKAIEFLKLKSFVVSTKLSDEEICAKSMQTSIIQLSKTVKPFVDFLNNALD
ncbi:MAG TPA: DUF2461 domain-containing protein [Chitinophagales bacterium]|nr:DUF2461 domain-containing protein [Chitinophagales bacterium]HNA39100.1 DUF2461 domain-containing protein [Chitinophagales bacterium]HNG71934.1 DUF2461 domain-containing protein [Chitinophagales bacterium]